VDEEMTKRQNKYKEGDKIDGYELGQAGASLLNILDANEAEKMKRFLTEK